MTIKLSRSEQKRQAILTAAKQAFQDNGVPNTSMDTIAALAEVSKRTVYNHFKSKELLVMELLRELWQSAMSDIDAPYLAQQALEPQFFSLIKAEVDFICSEQHIELLRMAFGHFFYQPEGLQDEVEKFSIEETALAKWLNAAHKDGRLHLASTDLAVQQVHSLIKGAGMWPQLFKLTPLLSEQEKQQLAESTVSMFLNSYRNENGE